MHWIESNLETRQASRRDNYEVVNLQESMKMNQSQSKQYDFVDDEVVCLPYDIVPLTFPTKVIFD